MMLCVHRPEITRSFDFSNANVSSLLEVQNSDDVKQHSAELPYIWAVDALACPMQQEPLSFFAKRRSSVSLDCARPNVDAYHGKFLYERECEHPTLPTQEPVHSNHV